MARSRTGTLWTVCYESHERRPKAAADDMRTYARSIELRQSGNMADSTHPLGPFASGGGILTSTIQSAASYADMVAQIDAAHDWPARTVADQQARLDQLQSD